MTTKTLSSFISAGYSLAAQYTVLSIIPTGGLGGYGLKLHGGATLLNNADIDGTGGVTAFGADTVINGSTSNWLPEITGYSGVFDNSGVLNVSNFGSITGTGAYGDGVFLVAGGSVTNGANNDTAARIYGNFSGVAASIPAKVVNFGTIRADMNDGVYLQAGGTITNGSTLDLRANIVGKYGVDAAAGPLTLMNFGLIDGLGGDAGVYTVGGGAITNGAINDTTATITGGDAGAESKASATLVNLGTVTGAFGVAVEFSGGGAITNGSAGDTHATLSGESSGVFAGGVATISNFGVIVGTTTGDGVDLNGGKITNGSATSTRATIQGAEFGVLAQGYATVSNFGLIDGVATDGVRLAAGGTITNGAASDPTALIEGKNNGIVVGTPSSVLNLGTVDANTGIYLQAGGTVTNGAASDITALVEGHGIGIIARGPALVRNFGTINGNSGVNLTAGILINGSTLDTTAAVISIAAVTFAGIGTVTNFGSLVSTGDQAATAMMGKGVVTNGAAGDTGALLEGGAYGVSFYVSAGVVTNFGTIEAQLSNGVAAGVHIAGGYTVGSQITNGSATDQSATIAGRMGVFVDVGGDTTVTNFGTITGFGGRALEFSGSGNLLNVESGCAFQGSVLGLGGTLNLASGVGVISLLTSAGDVTVSGSMAKTTFQDFSALEIGAGASFTDTGVGAVGAGDVLTVFGALSLAAVQNAGTLAVSGGTLTVNGAVSLSGSVSLNGGTADFASTFRQNVTFTAKGGVLELARSQTYTGQITGLATTAVTKLDLGDIAFISGTTKATFSGTTSSGTLTVTDGSHTSKITLIGDYLGSKFTVASDGHGGTTVTDPLRTPTASPSPSLPALVSAITTFAAPDGPSGAMTPGRSWETHMPMLARP